MSDIDCGNCDCGDCGDCTCGDCNCDCNCLDGDCGCNDCKCDCNECHPCDQFACGLCCGGCVNDTTDNVVQISYVDTYTTTSTNSTSHTRGHRKNKKKQQRDKYMVPNGELNNGPSNRLSNDQADSQVVMTQPGTAVNVVVSQPRGDPPPYDSVVGKATT